MVEPKFRSDVRVEFDDASTKGDRGIARRAWAVKPDGESPGHLDTELGWERVIRAMLKGKHGSPFEGGYLSVYVEAPVVVWWEWTRHRFMSLGCPDLAFNLESGRYKVLDGEFYLPPEGRPCKEPDGFKPMRPVLAEDEALRLDTVEYLTGAYRTAWGQYCGMVDHSVSREVARLCLPFGVYYAGYVSANPRTWLQFFSLRRKDERAEVATYPQYEIEKADEQCEVMFAQHWPLTYRLFNELGRVAV